MCFRKILFFKFSENMAEREPNQNQGSTSLVTVISPLARLFSLTSQFYLVYIEYRVYLGSISICPAHKFPTYLSIPLSIHLTIYLSKSILSYIVHSFLYCAIKIVVRDVISSLSICLSVYLSVYLSTCLSVYLYHVTPTVLFGRSYKS